MPVVSSPGVFSNVPVEKAMAKDVAWLPGDARISQAIRMMVRQKVNAVLVTQGEIPMGVVSKTDLITAMYAAFPLDTPLADIMGSQPIACFADDTIEEVLEIMAGAGVHRLYVIGASREDVIGTISYLGIVGLLYRYCRACEKGLARKRQGASGIDPAARFRVKEVMTRQVTACNETNPLTSVIETLTGSNVGAVLITDDRERPVGVISKTDLVFAYHHGVSEQTPAKTIMQFPVQAMAKTRLLSQAIQEMLRQDIQRLFVYDTNPEVISGVLALSDAARFRSGSCRACTAGRLMVS